MEKIKMPECYCCEHGLLEDGEWYCEAGDEDDWHGCPILQGEFDA